MNYITVLMGVIFIALVLSGFFIFRQFTDYALRTKFVVAFIAVTVVTLGAVVLVTSLVTRSTLVESIGLNLANQASTEGKQIGDFLSNNLNNLRILAINENLQNQVQTRNAKYSDNLNNNQVLLLEIDKRWLNIDDENLLIQSILTNPVARELKEFKDIFPDHVELFVTDRYGAVVGATNRTEDYYQADETWWKEAYNGGQGANYLGQLEFDESSDTLAVDIAVPVFDAQTKDVIGIIRSTFRMDALVGVISQITIGDTGIVEIIMPNDTKLSPNSSDQLTPFESETLAEVDKLSDGDFGQFDYDGDPSLVSKAAITATDNGSSVNRLGWKLLIHQDISEALFPVTSLLIASLVTTTGAIFLAVVAAFSLSKVLVGPISRLTEAAQRVNKGDLQVKAQVESKDETGQLAIAFNSMTMQLQEFIGSLESQVQARTSELKLSIEVGQKAAAIRELDELLPTITEFIRAKFNLYYVQIYFVDDTGKNLVLRKGTGTLGQQLLKKRPVLSMDSSSIVGQAFKLRKAIIVQDLKASDFDYTRSLLPDSRSELALPLMMEDKVVGVIDMHSEQVNAFTEDNLTVFEALSTQLAISIDSAQQWAASQESQQRMEEALRRLTRENWLDSLASRRKAPAYSYDLSDVTPLTDQVGNGNISVPVTIQNETVGELSVRTPDGRTLSEDERALMNAVAQQLAQKAENLRLFEQTQQRATREQIARQITDKIRSSRDIETALKTAAAELSKALGTARAVVDLKVQRSSRGPDES